MASPSHARVQGDTIQCAVIDDGSADAVISPGGGSGIVEGLASDPGGTVTRKHTVLGSFVILRVPRPQGAAMALRD